MEALRAALSFLTPQFFDWLILLVISAGLVAAALRLRRDLRRPYAEEDTRPLQE